MPAAHTNINTCYNPVRGQISEDAEMGVHLWPDTANGSNRSLGHPNIQPLSSEVARDVVSSDADWDSLDSEIVLTLNNFAS